MLNYLSFENTYKDGSAIPNVETDINYSNLTSKQRRNLFLQQMKVDDRLKMSMHIKWLFSKFINPKISKNNTNYNIQGYYETLLDIGDKDDYYKRGVLWLNEAFEKLYNNLDIISNLDNEMKATYKLLYLFIGESRYYNIALALARSVHSTTTCLCYVPSHIKKLSFYKSCIKISKTGLLDLMGLENLISELDSIFYGWKELPSKIKLKFAQFNKPYEQYLIEETNDIFKMLKYKGLYSDDSEKLAQNLDIYLQTLGDILLLQCYIRQLNSNKITCIDNIYLNSFSTDEPKNKVISEFTKSLVELYNQTQGFFAFVKPNDKTCRLDNTIKNNI